MVNTATHPSVRLRHEPSWWNDQHTRAWERVKSVFAHEWAQTDFVKAPCGYEDAEPALRYGYGASAYYFDHDVWDASLEAKLRDDWSEVDPSRNWADVRELVRRGWERARAQRH